MATDFINSSQTSAFGRCVGLYPHMQLDGLKHNGYFTVQAIQFALINFYCESSLRKHVDVTMFNNNCASIGS